MGEVVKKYLKMGQFWLVLLVAVAGLSGCATSRSVVEPTVPKSENPAQGPAIKIVQVLDNRGFAIGAEAPDTPSLSDDDIQNRATTSRAIARKRNTYGKALGDVLLPESMTVADITKSALEQAFRESGYRVFSPGQPGYDEAVPVTVSIRQFWAWMTPGFWAIALEHRGDLTLQGPVAPLQQGLTVESYVRETMQMAPESSWRDIVSKGLADLIAKTKAKLMPRTAAN